MPIDGIWDIKKPTLFAGAIIYFILFYFLVYNKERWSSYLKEFENESEQKRKSGNIKVICFLIGSIVLYILSFPILFSISSKIAH